MQPLNQITLGDIITYVRDLAIAGVVLKLGWKLRDVWQAVLDTKERIFRHMDVMESGMTTLLNNDLRHLQESVDKLHAVLPENLRTRQDTISELDSSRPESL